MYGMKRNTKYTNKTCLIDEMVFSGKGANDVYV